MNPSPQQPGKKNFRLLQRMMLILHYRTAGTDRMGQPHIAADYAVIPDEYIAAKNRGSGINHDMIPDIGMSLDPLD